MHFMHFSAIFVVLAVLATSVTPWYPPSGCEWGCSDSICLLGYERTCFALSSLAEGRQFLSLDSSKVEVSETFF